MRKLRVWEQEEEEKRMKMSVCQTDKALVCKCMKINLFNKETTFPLFLFHTKELFGSTPGLSFNLIKKQVFFIRADRYAIRDRLYERFRRAMIIS